VAHPAAAAHAGWSGAGVPAEHAIRGLHSVTLWLDANELTGQLLTNTLGFRLVREQGSIFRYATGDGEPGTIVDLRQAPGFFGVFETFGKYGLGIYGVPPDTAVTWAIGFHFLSYVPITMIGAWYFVRAGLSMHDLGGAERAATEEHEIPSPATPPIA